MGIALFFFVEKSVFEKQPSVDFPLLMEIYALLCRDRRLRTFLDALASLEPTQVAR